MTSSKPFREWIWKESNEKWEQAPRVRESSWRPPESSFANSQWGSVTHSHGSPHTSAFRSYHLGWQGRNFWQNGSEPCSLREILSVMSTHTSLFSTEAGSHGGTGTHLTTKSVMLILKGRTWQPQVSIWGPRGGSRATTVKVERGEAPSSLAAAALRTWGSADSH